MKLTNPTDKELEEAFAIHVAGWTKLNNGEWRSPAKTKRIEKTGICTDDLEYPPSYATNTNAILPLLETHTWRGCSYRSRSGSHFSARVEVVDHEFNLVVGESERSFPLAACVALLRAHGIEVEFTR
jgi:hypothetical protein